MNRINKKYMEAGMERLKGTRSNLKCFEAQQIAQSASMIEAIMWAFYVGVEAGARITEKKTRKSI